MQKPSRVYLLVIKLIIINYTVNKRYSEEKQIYTARGTLFRCKSCGRGRHAAPPPHPPVFVGGNINKKLNFRIEAKIIISFNFHWVFYLYKKELKQRRFVLLFCFKPISFTMTGIV